MTSSEQTATCPAIEIDIVNSDFTILDSTVFTYAIGDSDLVIETDDPSKVNLYELLVTAKYVGSAYSVAG